MRYSGVQGSTLVISNLIQLVSVMVVAGFLGPEEMARYALLLFLAGLVCQLLSLLVKPGTIRRVFGGDGGLMDQVCPPSTVYAAYNAYAGPKEIRTYPFNDHEGGHAFQERAQLAWLGEHLPIPPSP